MSRGRIVYGAISLLLYVGCSSYVPQTAVIDTGTRHLGDDTLWAWLVPEPEGKEISYTFELGRLGDESQYPFGVGFLLADYQLISFTINGEVFRMEPWVWGEPYPDIPADTIKDDFLRIWKELLEEDATYFADLEKMIEEEGFYPVVWPGFIPEGTLVKGTNTITFIATSGEEDLVDYMIGSIVISNEEAMDEIPRSYYR